MKKRNQIAAEMRKYNTTVNAADDYDGTQFDTLRNIDSLQIKSYLKKMKNDGKK